MHDGASRAGDGRLYLAHRERAYLAPLAMQQRNHRTIDTEQKRVG